MGRPIEGHRSRRWAWHRVAPAWALTCLCGCTSLSEWVRNGYKIGPNYAQPATPVAVNWIDAENRKLAPGNPNTATWWEVFDDPTLTRLIHDAAEQNLTVRQAGIQIIRANIQRDIAATELLPQAQTLAAQYARSEGSRNGGGVGGGGATFGIGLSPSAVAGGITSPSTPIAGTTAPITPAGTTVTSTSPPISGVAGGGGGAAGADRFFDSFGTSLNFAWELDLWGLFRRNLEAADASLDQSVQNQDAIMVQLLANVATQYVQIRTLQKRLDIAKKNVQLQEPLVARLEQQYKAGSANAKPAYYQLKSNLDATRALIPPLEILLRQANNQLCVLLGQPLHDLLPELDSALATNATDSPSRPIPRSKNETVALGIPADTLLCRPDVRALERQLRIQSAQIGIAEAELLPHIGLNGSIGFAANRFSRLFDQQSMIGTIGPSLTWNILNYGRLLANVRSQNCQYRQYVLAYQQAVLNANQDAENALVAYLQSLEQSRHLRESANSSSEVAKYYYNQLAEGYLPPAANSLSFYNQLFTAVNFQVQQQDAAAQAEGNIALNLILLYRALGGGWQIRGNNLPHCDSLNPLAAAP